MTNEKPIPNTIGGHVVHNWEFEKSLTGVFFETTDENRWEVYGKIFKNQKVFEEIKKRIKELQYQLDHTNPTPERSISLQETMQEMSNLIGFEEFEKILGEQK